MNKKIIISIGRQVGSGGRIIAQLLSEEFGCKFYDKELLNLAAKESGFNEKFFEMNDERKGFFKSLLHGNLPFVSSTTSFYGNEFSQDSLYSFQCDAIRKAAEEGSCVFVGRTADYILRNEPTMTSVFVTADINERIGRVAQRHQTSREEARRLITNIENQRSTYYNFYTGKRWGDSGSYDLCVNSSRLGLEMTARFVADFIRKRMGKLKD